jgi:hypothetical protein
MLARLEEITNPQFHGAHVAQHYAAHDVPRLQAEASERHWIGRHSSARLESSVEISGESQRSNVERTQHDLEPASPLPGQLRKMAAHRIGKLVDLREVAGNGPGRG